MDIQKHSLTADKWDKLLIPGGDEVTNQTIHWLDHQMHIYWCANTVLA